MATVLLVVIYIAFIGLGIPDSLFGTAWPAMGPALGAQVADASFVTVLISAGTVASSLMSARLIARFGPGIITAASTLATALALLGFSCAIEYTCNNWGGTFLTEGKGMTPDEAARMITVYYIGMTAGRFLSGLAAGRVRSWRLIGIGQGVVAAAVLLLLLPLPVPAAAIGLFLVGLGNGPVFPNLIYLTPRNFGRDRSQAVMGTQMAAANTGILLLPPVFGLLAQGAGAWLFPHFLLALALLMCLPTLFLVRRLRARGRYE